MPGYSDPTHASKGLEVVALPRRPLLAALLLVGLTSLVGPHARAESPAWLSLVRPQQGLVTYTAGVGVTHSEKSYAEVWSRVESLNIESFCGIQLYLCPIGARHQALVVDTKIAQAAEDSVMYSWTPEGPSSVAVTHNTGPIPQLHLGWQHEVLSPLWRRGVELGYAVSCAKNSQGRLDASVWLARAYEPVILSIASTYAPHEIIAAKAGAEVALTPRLALATDILWRWHCSGGKRLQPQVSLELGATLRQEDHSGWNLAVILQPETHSVAVGRSLPLQ